MHAQEQARGLGHDYIGTEHILLGLLLDEDGMAARALSECGVEFEAVRAEVERRIGRGEEPVRGHVPFTPRAKKVLELSLRQALKLGDSFIGTEHLLLALIAEGEGVGAQILRGREGGSDAVRDAVFRAMGRDPQPLVEPLEGRLAEIGRAVRARFPRVHALRTEDDEVRKRLEAIEARLSAIEQLLRELRGGAEEAS